MNDHSNDDLQARSGRGPDPLADLLRQAGARPQIDPLRRQRVEREVRRAWQASLRRRRQSRWAMALAACLALVALGVTWRSLPVRPPVSDVAVVVHMQGRAYELTEQGRRGLAVGERLRAGTRIETTAGARLALSIERLGSLRVDENSGLILIDDRHFDVQRGGLYLDSGNRDGGVEVSTPLLRASDIGTRFMVRHIENVSSVVAVRDGRVQVKAEGLLALNAGERLSVSNNGAPQRSALATNGSEWDWALQAAVPFGAEGRPLRELLDWYAHESGLQLRIAAGADLDQRLAAPLEGDVAGLDANELLDVARAAGPLTVRIDHAQGEMHVEP